MNPGEQVQENQHNLLEWLRNKASGPVVAVAGFLGVSACAAGNANEVTHTETVDTPGVPTPEATTETIVPANTGGDWAGLLKEKRYTAFSEDIVPAYPDKWPPSSGIDEDGLPAHNPYFQLPKDSAWAFCDVGTNKDNMGLLSVILRKSEADLEENGSCLGMASIQGGFTDPTGEVTGASLYSFELHPFNLYNLNPSNGINPPRQSRWLNFSLRSDSGGGANKLTKDAAKRNEFTVDGVHGFLEKENNEHHWFQVVDAVVDCPGIKDAKDHGIASRAVIDVKLDDHINLQYERDVTEEQVKEATQPTTSEEDTALKRFAAGMCLALQGN